MDFVFWGDIHFTPYEYDKMASMPSGYLMIEDPMDTRDLFDYKMQFVMMYALVLMMIVFLIGPTSLVGGDSSNRNFQDFLTINELEEEIRKIREENSTLLTEFKTLKGGEQ